ncbi:MAG: ABC transporter substrate-binding protein [Eubacteriales bacterium]|nr:ABC transporter substrate-binding protein [Eubacteriales bacterium]
MAVFLSACTGKSNGNAAATETAGMVDLNDATDTANITTVSNDSADTDKTTDTVNIIDTSDSTEMSDNIEAYDAVTFTDSLNREVTVKKNPERVAALLGSFADVWTLAGGLVCATVEDAWSDYGLDTADTVNIGGAHSPGLELLLSASPEFVIASSATKSNVEMLDTLNAAGITVAYFDVSNFDDYLHMLDVLTDITSRKDLYEEYGLKLKESIEETKKDYASLPLTEDERKILLIRTSASSVKAKGSSGTILGEMLKDMGCINIADSDETLLENLSIEAIIKENPSMIFVTTMGKDTETALNAFYSIINENPAWSSLTAVKENRIHVMDKTLFNSKPNSRWAEAYRILYEALTEK